jgi:predicted dehydrogenase
MILSLPCLPAHLDAIWDRTKEQIMATSRRDFLLTSAAAAATAGAQTPADAPRPLRIAFIGTGHRGWNHIRVVKSIPGFEIVALADPTPDFRDRAATLAGSGVKLYSTYQELLSKEKGLDAVIIATPQFLHTEISLAALASGLHVFCEKPLATKAEDANRVVEAVKKSGKIFQIGQQWRYTPVYETIGNLVRQGAVGPVEYVIGSNFRGDWNPESWKYADPNGGTPTNWRLLRATSGTSIAEASIHQLDVLHGIIGSQVTRIFATGGNNVYKDRETIDHAGLLLEYENGVKFEFGMNLFTNNAGSINRMVVIGKEGTIQPESVDQQTPSANAPRALKVAVRKNTVRAPELHDAVGSVLGAKESSLSGPLQSSPEYRQLVAFEEAVRTGKQPLNSVEVGRDAVKISLLAQKSIDERRPVLWNELP